MSDALISAAVAAAEQAVADTPLQVRVLTAAQPLVPPDKVSYEALRRHLTGLQRTRLDCDFYLWQEAFEFLERLTDLARKNADDPSTIGPLKKRLMRPLARSPRFWKVCEICSGKGNGDIGYCRGCEGNGYVC
jgi:hypothetical protein